MTDTTQSPILVRPAETVATELRASPPRCLLVVAHPRLDRSTVNARLVDAAAGLAGVEVHDLYDAYPDYQIDVAAEQERLRQHDVIGLQFPLFWYSVPALLKEWLDLVWLHGFAYGGRAPSLAGKVLFCTASTGGDAHSYREDGRNGHSMDEFLRPLERTAVLCRMRWAEPYLLHDAPRLQGEKLEHAAGDYVRYLDALMREAAR
ncbi:NAD(P)H-dependent oxidoreductase [Ancylobacter oerskovii]|uniref:NAD(P)H-dependent oxidoreductase n=1 Tax=Ancylobacter oerskovii TaxID=459519 RepID=A0ABW4Z544_9HYPH|nr:NAD(P)H-dependent oxidoreductase [Ancylobacter oerskovii]MBS7546416.1 NAD(P)H-dependent oxidoreductase [Ancylobacter oerskovii]